MASKPKLHDAKHIKVTDDEVRPLTDAEVKGVSGGMMRLEAFVKISGPSWVNLMTYRKPGANAEPSRKRSVSELYRALAAAPAKDA